MSPSFSTSSEGGDHSRQEKAGTIEDVELKDSPVFSNPASDFALISSDNVRFLVFRNILSEASPWFESMFTLPQPHDPNDNSIQSLPFVRMEETSEILEVLLQYIYPRQNPFPTFNQICLVLRAVDKFEMDWMKGILRELLVSEKFLTDQPLAVFIASRFYNLFPEASVACRHTFDSNLNDFKVAELVSQLSFMNLDKSFILEEFIGLVQFHHRRSARMIELLRPSSINGSKWPCSCDCTPPRHPDRWCYIFFGRVLQSLLQKPTTTGLFDSKRINEALAGAGCASCIRRWQERDPFTTWPKDALEKIPANFESEASYSA
jgi:hypothetical protein